MKWASISKVNKLEILINFKREKEQLTNSMADENLTERQRVKQKKRKARKKGSENKNFLNCHVVTIRTQFQTEKSSLEE